tara:strand:+ start:319 stop:4089 length:3771 start_codon:yes stop_codon:yes gene_type:complete
MPKDLLEIKGFNLGTVTAVDADDIPKDAAVSSLDIEPLTVEGTLTGRNGDDVLTASSGSYGSIGNGAFVDNPHTKLKDFIYHNKDDNKIKLMADFHNNKNPVDVDGPFTSANEIAITPNNNNVHIGFGGESNKANQWIGYSTFKQFGNESEAIISEPDKMERAANLPVFVKCVEDADFIYSIDAEGTYIYKTNKVNNSTLRSVQKYEDLTALCLGGNETDDTGLSTRFVDSSYLWVWSRTKGDQGTLIHVDRGTLQSHREYTIVTKYDDGRAPYVSDMIDNGNYIHLAFYGGTGFESHQVPLTTESQWVTHFSTLSTTDWNTATVMGRIAKTSVLDTLISDMNIPEAHDNITANYTHFSDTTAGAVGTYTYTKAPNTCYLNSTSAGTYIRNAIPFCNTYDVASNPQWDSNDEFGFGGILEWNTALGGSTKRNFIWQETVDSNVANWGINNTISVKLSKFPFARCEVSQKGISASDAPDDTFYFFFDWFGKSAYPSADYSSTPTNPSSNYSTLYVKCGLNTINSEYTAAAYALTDEDAASDTYLDPATWSVAMVIRDDWHAHAGTQFSDEGINLKRFVDGMGLNFTANADRQVESMSIFPVPVKANNRRGAIVPLYSNATTNNGNVIFTGNATSTLYAHTIPLPPRGKVATDFTLSAMFRNGVWRSLTPADRYIYQARDGGGGITESSFYGQYNAITTNSTLDLSSMGYDYDNICGTANFKDEASITLNLMRADGAGGRWGSYELTGGSYTACTAADFNQEYHDGGNLGSHSDDVFFSTIECVPYPDRDNSTSGGGGELPNITPHVITGKTFSGHTAIKSSNLDVTIQASVANASTLGYLNTETYYYYKFAFEYDGYQESPLGESSDPILGTDKALNFSFSISALGLSKRITGLKIYQSEATDSSGANILYRLVDVKSLESGWTAVSDPIWGDVWSSDVDYIHFGSVSSSYDSETGISEVLENTNVSYAMSAALNNTLFQASCFSIEIGEQPNYLYRSLPYKYSMTDILKDVLILPETPTALASFGGRIWAFSENNTYRIEPNDFYIEDTLNGIGCSGQNAIVVTEYGMCFANSNGVWLNTGKQTIPISNGINLSESGTDGFTEAYTVSPYIVFNGRRNAFVIVMNENIAWVYSVDKKRWDKWSLPSDSDSISGVFTGKQGEVYIGCTISATNSLVKYAESSTRKSYTWESKDIVADTPTQDKRWYKLKKVGTGTVTTVPDISSGSAKSKSIKISIAGSSTDVIEAVGVVYRRLSIR